MVEGMPFIWSECLSLEMYKSTGSTGSTKTKHTHMTESTHCHFRHLTPKHISPQVINLGSNMGQTWVKHGLQGLHTSVITHQYITHQTKVHHPSVHRSSVHHTPTHQHRGRIGSHRRAPNTKSSTTSFSPPSLSCTISVASRGGCM